MGNLCVAPRAQASLLQLITVVSAPEWVSDSFAYGSFYALLPKISCRTKKIGAISSDEQVMTECSGCQFVTSANLIMTWSHT